MCHKIVLAIIAMTMFIPGYFRSDEIVEDHVQISNFWDASLHHAASAHQMQRILPGNNKIIKLLA